MGLKTRQIISSDFKKYKLGTGDLWHKWHFRLRARTRDNGKHNMTATSTSSLYLGGQMKSGEM